ncbi:MAG: sugar phosphate isomerase/epimerase [Lentisphaerae bacterium]|nr:sugar phosphate isomerase/epimerase [Lentisphaerota bacterium]
MKEFKTGLQLYNFRRELNQDFPGTLEKISRLGYRGVEFYGNYGGMEPRALADFLRKLGLQCAGTMFKPEQLEDQNSDAFEYAKALQSPAVTFGVFIDFAKEYQALQKRCEVIGKNAMHHGTVLSYHNHWLEFTLADGIPAMNRILEACNPAAVFLELDVCWLSRAGLDPASYIRKYSQRIRQIHFKDIIVPDDPATTCELGRGCIDLQGAYQAACESACEWLIYEQDNTTLTPWESAAISLEYLHRLGAR